MIRAVDGLHERDIEGLNVGRFDGKDKGAVDGLDDGSEVELDTGEVEIMIVGSHGDVDCMTEMLMDYWMETPLTEWLEL